MEDLKFYHEHSAEVESIPAELKRCLTQVRYLQAGAVVLAALLIATSKGSIGSIIGFCVLTIFCEIGLEVFRDIRAGAFLQSKYQMIEGVIEDVEKTKLSKADSKTRILVQDSKTGVYYKIYLKIGIFSGSSDCIRGMTVKIYAPEGGQIKSNVRQVYDYYGLVVLDDPCKSE